MKKKQSILIFLSLLLLPLLPLPAQSEGIPLQKDVLLGAPILGPEDLPEEITFTLYDSKTALEPLGFQTFTRGQYTVDFEFKKSDGISSGNVARVSADFTKTLNLKDAEGDAIQPKEIWAALEVVGAEIGDRNKVSDETLVQLLLASNASIATYLTLVYEGDGNPIATIYKDLPILSLSSDASGSSLKNYFSAVAAGASEGVIEPNANGAMPDWESAGANIWYKYSNGNVGIGTDTPLRDLHIYRLKNVDMTLSQSSSSGVAWYYYGNDVGTSVAGVGFSGSAYPAYGGGNALMFLNFLNAPITFHTAKVQTPRLIIAGNGNVGVGTSNPTYKLSVNGTIRAKEIIVDTLWSDFVFEDGYRLPPLQEVEQFISENKHLPSIPSESEVKENGADLGSVSSKLLQKIEELTLYVIDLKKESDSLKAELAAVKQQLDKTPR